MFWLADSTEIANLYKTMLFGLLARDKDNSMIDLAFPICGTRFPLEHGYLLYASLCRVLPYLHKINHIGIHPIRGRIAGRGELYVTKLSRLRIRLPAEIIGTFLPLAGRCLALDGHHLRLGAPTVYALKPSASTVARMVTIKGFMASDDFLSAARRQLDALNISAEAELAIPLLRTGRSTAGQPDRRILRIKDKTVIGFGLRVSNLTAEESLALQEYGLGGRRHMGCGLFLPTRG